MKMQNYELKNEQIRSAFLELKRNHPERLERRLNLSWSNWGFGIEALTDSAARLRRAGIGYVELHGNHYGPDLGYKPDERDYGIAANILKNLKVESIRLLTNNPEKIQQLTAHGIKITERVPLIMEPTEYNRSYLETKAARSGHLLGKLAELTDISKIQSLSE